MTDRTPAKRSRTDQARQVAGIVAAALFVLFAVLNTQSVEIDWIVTTTRTPLIVALIVSAILGAVAGYVLARAWRRRRRSR